MKLKKRRKKKIQENEKFFKTVVLRFAFFVAVSL